MNDKTFTFTALDQRASGTITIVDYTMLAGKTFTVGSDTLTEGADFNAATSNTVTATNLAAAIDALAGVGATSALGVVTITNDTPGTAGNSKALSTNAAAGGATVSAATLSGGVDDTYFGPFQVDPQYTVVDFQVSLTSITGSGPQLSVLPQVSIDNVGYDYARDDAGDTINNVNLTVAGSQVETIVNPLNWVRFDVELSGDNAVATGTIKVLAKER
jgi:hypothetical protein